jgi:hypothetical protein
MTWPVGPDGEQTVRFLVGRGRLESFEASDLPALAEALLARASRRLEITARAALRLGDAEGSYAAAYDAYRNGRRVPSVAARAQLDRRRRLARSHPGRSCCSVRRGDTGVRQATFERLRMTRPSVQYFDPASAPVSQADTEWAVGKLPTRSREPCGCWPAHGLAGSFSRSSSIGLLVTVS